MPLGRYRRRLSRDSTWFEYFALVGCFSFRVVNYAEQITEAPMQQGFFLHLRGRFRISENKGRCARMVWSLNQIATTDLRAA